MELLQLSVESTAAAVEVETADVVVVLPAAGRQAQHQASARQPVDRRCLLCEQCRVRPQWADEDVGDEADALRDSRGCPRAIRDS
jgi:hypothetical protein